MSGLHKLLNLIAVALPAIVLPVAIVLLWNTLVSWTDLVLLVVMYGISALGITLGYHRLLTHRSFSTYRPVRWALAIAGSMAAQGQVLTWVADHRKHHTYPDAEGDPHTPHGHGEGVGGALRGLWHAHVGWLFKHAGSAERNRYVRDLLADRGMRLIDKTFLVWVLAGLAIPFGIGWAIGGSAFWGLTALIWAGLVRIFILHHVTFSINSVCHFMGRRRFESPDESRNVFWLALPSMGESWHNNHHAFPTSARHGISRGEVDVTYGVIKAMEKAGLAWDVVTPSPERIRAGAAS